MGSLARQILDSHAVLWAWQPGSPAEVQASNLRIRCFSMVHASIREECYNSWQPSPLLGCSCPGQITRSQCPEGKILVMAQERCKSWTDANHLQRKLPVVTLFIHFSVHVMFPDIQCVSAVDYELWAHFWRPRRRQGEKEEACDP